MDKRGPIFPGGSLEAYIHVDMREAPGTERSYRGTITTVPSSLVETTAAILSALLVAPARCQDPSLRWVARAGLVIAGSGTSPMLLAWLMLDRYLKQGQLR